MTSKVSSNSELSRSVFLWMVWTRCAPEIQGQNSWSDQQNLGKYSETYPRPRKIVKLWTVECESSPFIHSKNICNASQCQTVFRELGYGCGQNS